jgi:glutamate-1-semialdehyde 2,1-aminomutase
MTCFGKIIGGGFPVGAYGGRKDIMKHLSPLGGVYQAGTFAGNPIVMRAGLATLKNLNSTFYKSLNLLAEDFAQSVNASFQSKKTNAHLSCYKGMFSVRFRRQEVRNYTDAQSAGSNAIYSKLFSHLLRNQIYLPPADLEAFFISSAHSRKNLSSLAKALNSFNKYA